MLQVTEPIELLLFAGIEGQSRDYKRVKSASHLINEEHKPNNNAVIITKKRTNAKYKGLNFAMEKLRNFSGRFYHVCNNNIVVSGEKSNCYRCKGKAEAARKNRYHAGGEPTACENSNIKPVTLNYIKEGSKSFHNIIPVTTPPMDYNNHRIRVPQDSYYIDGELSNENLQNTDAYFVQGESYLDYNYYENKDETFPSQSKQYPLTYQESEKIYDNKRDEYVYDEDSYYINEQYDDYQTNSALADQYDNNFDEYRSTKEPYSGYNMNEGEDYYEVENEQSFYAHDEMKDQFHDTANINDMVYESEIMPLRTEGSSENSFPSKPSAATLGKRSDDKLPTPKEQKCKKRKSRFRTNHIKIISTSEKQCQKTVCAFPPSKRYDENSRKEGVYKFSLGTCLSKMIGAQKEMFFQVKKLCEGKYVTDMTRLKIKKKKYGNNGPPMNLVYPQGAKAWPKRPPCRKQRICKCGSEMSKSSIDQKGKKPCPCRSTSSNSQVTSASDTGLGTGFRDPSSPCVRPSTASSPSSQQQPTPRPQSAPSPASTPQSSSRSPVCSTACPPPLCDSKSPPSTRPVSSPKSPPSQSARPVPTGPPSQPSTPRSPPPAFRPPPPGGTCPSSTSSQPSTPRTVPSPSSPRLPIPAHACSPPCAARVPPPCNLKQQQCFTRNCLPPIREGKENFESCVKNKQAYMNFQENSSPIYYSKSTNYDPYQSSASKDQYKTLFNDEYQNVSNDTYENFNSCQNYNMMDQYQNISKDQYSNVSSYPAQNVKHSYENTNVERNQRSRDQFSNVSRDRYSNASKDKHSNISREYHMNGSREPYQNLNRDNFQKVRQEVKSSHINESYRNVNGDHYQSMRQDSNDYRDRNIYEHYEKSRENNGEQHDNYLESYSGQYDHIGMDEFERNDHDVDINQYVERSELYNESTYQPYASEVSQTMQIHYQAHVPIYDSENYSDYDYESESYLYSEMNDGQFRNSASCTDNESNADIIHRSNENKG